MTMLALARFTFREAVRKRIVVVALALTAVFLALFALGTDYAVRELEDSRILLPSFRPVALTQILTAGIWVVSLASSLLAIFTACGAFSTEIESGALHSLVSKPVQRWHLVLGKWLGLAGMVAVYTLVVGGLVIAVVWLRSGYAPPSLPLALAGLVLQSLVLLSLTLLGSVFVSALAAGVGAVMLHAVAMAGGMQEQIGAFLRNQTMLDIGIWVSLVLPSDALARLAASGLQGPAASALGMVGPLSVLSPPSVWMALYAALYAAVCLSLTIARFDSMDL